MKRSVFNPWKDKEFMKMLGWIVVPIILGLLLVGCSKVDEYGITNEITVQYYQTEKGAINALKNEVMIICKKAGYKEYKLLSIYTRTSMGLFRATGVGECIKVKR